jgi:YggT family protein
LSGDTSLRHRQDLDIALTVYLWIIVIRAVLSWVNRTLQPLVRMLYQLTEPVLARVRRWIPIGDPDRFLPPGGAAGHRFLQSFLVQT